MHVQITMWQYGISKVFFCFSPIFMILRDLFNHLPRHPLSHGLFMTKPVLHCHAFFSITALAQVDKSSLYNLANGMHRWCMYNLRGKMSKQTCFLCIYIYISIYLIYSESRAFVHIISIYMSLQVYDYIWHYMTMRASLCLSNNYM